ncbi:SAG-related sequence [Besnoitia besnoiti]|uniref:SAG-related sequence n=1 Tax=Besnoitia besnoiti TaxID=94643 RepID=A0A2A9MHY9_BESBE|nr:SAG-related sequence [Besnoitia besnoiti]PFH36814.1 SAG-related sequence [Besnoitia besnoiti]
MASPSNVQCSVAPLRGLCQSLPGGQYQRRQSTYSFKAVTVMLVAVSATLLQPSSISFEAAAAAEVQKSKCADSEGGVQCSCSKEDPSKDLVALSTTITDKRSEMELICNDSLQHSPRELKSTFVCPATTTDLLDCETSEPTATLDINSLLAASAAKVTWNEKAVENNPPTTRTLSIPKERFPYVDEKFVVGCTGEAVERQKKTKCTVTVTVAARATVTENQKVTCAYGSGSNTKHQAAALSPSNNSFTILCGDKGEIVQTNYKLKFCPVSDTKGAVTDCSEDYKTVLPGYEEGWWTGDNARGFTFTVPKDKFPRNEAKFMIQCQKSSNARGNGKAEPDAEAPSVCSVDVTVEGSGQESLSPASSSVGSTGLLLLIGALPHRESQVPQGFILTLLQPPSCDRVSRIVPDCASPRGPEHSRRLCYESHRCSDTVSDQAGGTRWNYAASTFEKGQRITTCTCEATDGSKPILDGRQFGDLERA